jgi:hypothetical protein
MTITFKQIQIGETFEFISNLNGYDRPDANLTGEFVKVSTRKYRQGERVIRICGSIETRVRRIGSATLAI